MPLGDATLLDHALSRVRSCTDRLVVNVHHGRQAIEEHLDSGVALSVEQIDGLGTAGGVANARPLIGDSDLIVVNADTWCPEDLSPVVDSWDRERVRVVVSGVATLTPRSKIVASLMPASAVAALEVAPSGLFEACWSVLAAEGRLDVVGWDGPIIDCATPRDLLAANMVVSEQRSVIGSGAIVDGHTVRSVVWPGGRVWPDEVLVDAIRTDGAMTVLIR